MDTLLLGCRLVAVGIGVERLQVKIGQDLVDVTILFSRFLAASMLLH